MNPAPVIQWAVTGLCNYRCRHCFVGNAAEELPLSGLETLIDRMAEAGVREVILTGGEPLMRPDLPELLELLNRSGIRVAALSTNGSLLTEALLRQFEESGHRPEITVSYDGDGGWHDWLRNETGSEAAVFRALDLCQAAGFTSGALMTLHSGNLGVLRSGLRRLYAHGCATVKVKPLLPLGRAAEPGAEVRCAGFSEINEAFLDAIAGYYAGEYPMRLRLGGFFAVDPERKGWSSPAERFPAAEEGNGRPAEGVSTEDGHGRLSEERAAEDRRGLQAEEHAANASHGRLLCGHADVFPFLTAGGRLLPCAGLAALDSFAGEAPSLIEMSLEDAMRSPAFRRFADYTAGEQLERNAECAACPSWAECGGGCRMNALAFGNGFHGCDGSCCAFFQQGWREKIPDAIRRGLFEKLLRG